MGGVGGGTQRAFAIGSLFLSVLPLAVVGGAVWYLRRRAKAIEREAQSRRVEAVTGSARLARMITLYHAPQSRSSRIIWLLEEARRALPSS